MYTVVLLTCTIVYPNVYFLFPPQCEMSRNVKLFYWITNLFSLSRHKCARHKGHVLLFWSERSKHRSQKTCPHFGAWTGT